MTCDREKMSTGPNAEPLEGEVFAARREPVIL